MKRKHLPIILLLALATVAGTLPSCRSAKGSDSSRYEMQKGGNRKGRPKKKKDKADKKPPKTDSKIVKEAYDWLGTPYGYSKAEKGQACDCSGMVMSVYQKVTGVKLPRNSAQQQDFCKKLKEKDVRPGDLCFFATGKDPERTSHVGIMIDETNFIHSSTSKGVVVSDITQPYWIKTFRGYGRVPEP